MKLLGTLTSLEKFIHLGRLHLRSLQFYLKAQWSRETDSVDVVIPIMREIKSDLEWWLVKGRLTVGLDLRPLSPDLSLYSDASATGWEAHLSDKMFRANGLQSFA